MRRTLLSRFLPAFALMLLVSGAGSSGTDTVPFETIAKGEISGYRQGDPAFAGGELLIASQAVWERFWAEHTAGQVPAPPLPEVKFPVENVLVALLGYQTTGGGPSIEITGIEDPPDRETVIHVEEDRTPGPLDVITNPYHIVKTERVRWSVTWLHEKP